MKTQAVVNFFILVVVLAIIVALAASKSHAGIAGTPNSSSALCLTCHNK